MVSSTFTDLQGHRAALIDAIHAHKLHANVMENDSARLIDVIDSSLQMVLESAAYIGVISLKYGQTPECPIRNPDQLSITELEFNKAQGFCRPILLFIMGDDHPVKKADIEKDPEKERKLNAFRERAKKASPRSGVNRVYAVFNSLEEFKDKLGSSLAELNRHLDAANSDTSRDDSPEPKGNEPGFIPSPPVFYAEPDYIGSHQFVGRAAELQALSDWAAQADPTNLLLFEAIGGNGKSMLTWEWTTKHAPNARAGGDAWAGRFWYSFYERGAIMADFCRRVLAYMTGRPLGSFAKKKTAELKDELLSQLHSRPWLLILDGLERVLVAYHRIDAAEVSDEEVNAPTDKIAQRNPRDAIRDEDNDLLRALAAAAPSKILVSSRLTPRVLLNPSGQPVPGAKRITLPGLRPPDAEKLLRSCGIEGNSAAIQSYLTANCDNHPLVIGILGGLIANYLPARGNFDAWSTAEDGGASLDLASLDLIQRRNHILRAALDALPAPSKQLLSTLALLTDSVDYVTLGAFNPHLPPEPEEIALPKPLEERWHLVNGKKIYWEQMSDKQKSEHRSQYEVALSRWQDRDKAVQARLVSPEFRSAPKKLETTVTDLEQRGLLQWDGGERKYNLHPVVRGVASSAMSSTDRERHGQRVVDHFSSLPYHGYDAVETLDDLHTELTVVRTLLKLGHLEQAWDILDGDLGRALLFKVEAYTEVLSLLRSFFSSGWNEVLEGVDSSIPGTLLAVVAVALNSSGEFTVAFVTHLASLRLALEASNWEVVGANLVFLSRNLCDRNVLSKMISVDALCLGFSNANEAPDGLRESCKLFLALDHSRLAQWAEAESYWQVIDRTKNNHGPFNPSYVEYFFALSRYWKGTLQENDLASVERLAVENKDRAVLRKLHTLRGDWKIEQGEWALAAASYQEAVQLARERSLLEADPETGLALAKHHLGQLADPQREAERLAQLRHPANRLLSRLWFDLGNLQKAKHHALAAYRWAWADGEPYVHRYELTKTVELLRQLNVPVPALPPYDPANDEPFSWEADVRAFIEKSPAKKREVDRSADEERV